MTGAVTSNDMISTAVTRTALEQAAAALVTGSATARDAWRKAGAPSAAAFSSAFTDRYGLTAASLAGARQRRSVRLPYGGPYDAPMTLRYLGRDPHNQAEVVHGQRYSRFITLDEKPLPVTLTLAARACTLEFPARLSARDILRLIDTTRHMLGLRQPVAAFQRKAAQHDVLRPIVQAMPGVRMIQTPNLWEALSWAIIGQQINLAFAYKLRNRLIFLGNGHDAPAPRPLPFPTPRQVLGITPDALKQVQFSRQKIAYLLELARQFESDGLAALSLEAAAPEEIEARLLSIKGLGRWSVAYGMMRGLGHLDALPVGDAGLRQALRARFNLDAAPDPATQERLMAPFRPYRSLATYYLWKSLDPANFA